MLKLENVEISVNDKKLFNNLNLNINNKEIHVIMGPNGIGKSSICQSIIGNPDYQVKGNIIFNNTVINDLGITERSRMGIYIINQNPIAIEGVTNAEMLRTVLTEITGSHVSIFEFNQKLEHICDELKIDKSFIHRNINDGMSGGERKKNELMHMLMLEPKFIILDEIDSGLDVDSIKVVSEVLKKYYDTHDCSMLIVTHHNNILSYLKPDYVHIVKNHKIVKSGTSDLALQIEEKGFDDIND